MPNFENDTTIQHETTDEPVDDTSDQTTLAEFPKQFLSTLPNTFNSLVGIAVGIENENPQDVIESLGYYLGVSDYRTSMASFWFLDTIAGLVLRQKANLDDHYISVLITWLAGEMKLIRDRRLSRERFFEEMRGIFDVAANKVSQDNRLSHWDEFVPDESVEGGEETDMGEEEDPGMEETGKSFSSMDPIPVLNIVIQSTYDMYANELRYSLIYTVFVKQIEVQTHRLPFNFRVPRPVKLADPDAGVFDTRLQKLLWKSIGRKAPTKRAKQKGKGKKGKRKEPVIPPPSLTDEELLINNRRFILPLIEANEAAKVFDLPDNYT